MDTAMEALLQAAKAIGSLAYREIPMDSRPPLRGGGKMNPHSRKRARPATKYPRCRYPIEGPQAKRQEDWSDDSREQMTPGQMRAAVDDEEEATELAAHKRIRGRKTRRRPKRPCIRSEQSPPSPIMMNKVLIDSDTEEDDEAEYQEDSSYGGTTHQKTTTLPTHARKRKQQGG